MSNFSVGPKQIESVFCFFNQGLTGLWTLVETSPMTSLVLFQRFQAERERQYELPQAHRPPKPPKEPYLIEQVFSPHPYTPSLKAHVKGSPLYTDLRLTSMSDGKRSQPSWTIEEYKRNSGEKGKQLTALDLQVPVTVNNNNTHLPPNFKCVRRFSEAKVQFKILQ